MKAINTNKTAIAARAAKFVKSLGLNVEQVSSVSKTRVTINVLDDFSETKRIFRAAGAKTRASSQGRRSYVIPEVGGVELEMNRDMPKAERYTTVTLVALKSVTH